MGDTYQAVYRKHLRKEFSTLKDYEDRFHWFSTLENFYTNVRDANCLFGKFCMDIINSVITEVSEKK